VSEQLPSREQALQLLHQTGCSARVVKHCDAVAELAVEIAQTCKERGLTVNAELVEIGALLHDIGRAKTHTVHHAVVGAEIAKNKGLPEAVVSIIKRHVGGGIDDSEAEELGWPNDIYVPQTLEEKIVAYADKLIEGSRRVPIERTVNSLSRKIPHGAVERIIKLHVEMTTLVGDCQCRP